MTLWHYLSVGQTLDIQGLTEGLVDRFGELVGRGHSVADLLSHYGDDFGHLPAERLSELHNARRQYLTWDKRRRQLDQVREANKLPALPEAAISATTSPDGLDAVFRTARLCERTQVETDEQWSAVLKAGFELWRRCISLARKHGRVRCKATNLDHPEASRYDEYLRLDDLVADLATHRWLAMRRAKRDGVLTVALEIDSAPLLEQVELIAPRLGPPAADRQASSLLDELVLDDLESWLLQIMFSEAEDKAIASAAKSLGGLLRGSGVAASRLGAAYVSRDRAPAAFAVLDREGDLFASKVLKADGAWIDKALAFLNKHGVQQVVVPTSAPAAELLASVESALANEGMQLIKIRTAALSDARVPLTSPPQRLGSSVASAVVLARRAIDPLKEWSSVDPVSIGVAEYQNDIDADRLRAALKQTVELCLFERRRGKTSHTGTSVPRGGAAMSRLNPLVKSLADLRPGMTVNGVVTNISHFGAFINIGLPQEGLAHISALSDDYVNDPNEVVNIGQQVTAHILQIDGARGRISLSLKTQRPTDLREGRSGGKTSKSPPKSKAEALASLERLFKK